MISVMATIYIVMLKAVMFPLEGSSDNSNNRKVMIMYLDIDDVFDDEEDDGEMRMK